MIFLKNCEYLCPERKFVNGDIFIEDENIISAGPCLNAPDGCKIVDVEGSKVIPGLIDIHMHGALGHDIMDASLSELQDIALYLARTGTTSFLPTTITSPVSLIEDTAVKTRQSIDMPFIGASIEGIHVEGPYINSEYKGCHDPAWIKTPDIRDYKRLKDIMGPGKIHITLAPEIQGTMDFIRYVCQNGDTVSIGHTDAGYDTVNQALEAGASVFTHLFNGMRGIHHREPGTAGAALESKASVELICDGIHVHPGVVNLIYKLKGRGGIVLVTDAMQAAGLGDGEYMFGGFKINVIDGVARKEDGTLASSTLSLFKAVKNMMKFTGAPLEDAVTMASLNPAKAVRIDNITGSIEPGKRADLIVLDKNLEIDSVYCRGKKIVNM